MIVNIAIFGALLAHASTDTCVPYDKQECRANTHECEWFNLLGCLKRPVKVPATKALCATGSANRDTCRATHGGCTWANLEQNCQVRVQRDDPRGCYNNEETPCKPCGIRAFGAWPQNEDYKSTYHLTDTKRHKAPDVCDCQHICELRAQLNQQSYNLYIWKTGTGKCVCMHTQKLRKLKASNQEGGHDQDFYAGGQAVIDYLSDMTRQKQLHLLVAGVDQDMIDDLMEQDFSKLEYKKAKSSVRAKAMIGIESVGVVNMVVSVSILMAAAGCIGFIVRSRKVNEEERAVLV